MDRQLKNINKEIVFPLLDKEKGLQKISNHAVLIPQNWYSFPVGNSPQTHPDWTILAYLRLLWTVENFLNGAETSLNSGNLMNHWSMNWAQFKDPVSHMCHASAVVASWPLTQEVADSGPFTVMTSIFVTEFAEFSETLRKNSNIDTFLPY